MDDTTLHVRLYFDRDDPDGSECSGCGDMCYLTMWRLFLSCGRHGRVVRSSGKTVLCDSCHQVLMEVTNNGDRVE